MKTRETKTSTGGTLVEYFDKNGNRVRAQHTAGRAYSGKIATEESKVKKPLDWFEV